MKLRFTQTAFDKIYFLQFLSDIEISAIGTAKISRDSVLVKDVFVIKQKCHPANTTMDTDALARFLYEWQKSGKNTKDINFWYHSHCDFSATPSGADERNIEEHSRNGKFVSLVASRADDWYARLDYFNKDDKQVTERLDVEQYPQNRQLIGWAREQIRRHVTRVRPGENFASEDYDTKDDDGIEEVEGDSLEENNDGFDVDVHGQHSKKGHRRRIFGFDFGFGSGWTKHPKNDRNPGDHMIYETYESGYLEERCTVEDCEKNKPQPIRTV